MSLCLSGLSAQDQCYGNIGAVSNVGDPTNPPEQGVLYMNEVDTSNCTGMITRINYCYHPVLDSSIALVAVYRRMGRSLVKSSRTVIISSNHDQITQNFVCDYLVLEEPIEVMDGDILGACLPVVSGNQTLQIVSESNEATTDLRSTSCSADLPDNVRRDRLSTDMNRILHLYADISELKQAN